MIECINNKGGGCNTDRIQEQDMWSEGQWFFREGPTGAWPGRAEEELVTVAAITANFG